MAGFPLTELQLVANNLIECKPCIYTASLFYALDCAVVLKWTAPGLSETEHVEEWGWVKKCLTYNPGASSWAPSPRAWWLCKRHEPPQIRWAGTAPRRCDPSESVPTFSPGSVDNHLKNQLQGEGQSKCIWYSPTKNETESKVALQKLTMSISPFGFQPERLNWRIQKHKNICLRFISKIWSM